MTIALSGIEGAFPVVENLQDLGGDIEFYADIGI